jgi:hypothetical protein
MAEMGKYCKAYLVKDFRRFEGWAENLDDLRSEDREDAVLDDDDILYLQETYVVTDGIFLDENVVFDQVTEEWQAFCRDELDFEIPEYEPIDMPHDS